MSTQEDLRLALEGLAQMQEADAGYLVDPENRELYEIEKYNRDIQAQCEAIDRLERKLAREAK
jgi:hypothetical protein